MVRGEYLHLFDTESEFQEYITGSGYTEPFVSVTPTNGENNPYRVNYNLSEYDRLLNMPLTFEILSNGVLRWSAIYGDMAKTIQYSKNSGEWTEITSVEGSSAPTISVVSGDIVQFRGNNMFYAYNQFFATCTYKLSGNIMSLIDSTGFATATTLQSGGTFLLLFSANDGLTNANKLVLPATTLSEHCYALMFEGCTGLTTAPELPATTLATECYESMFRRCASLTTAPDLPATVLANSCYNQMFSECTSLNYIKCLATDISATDCTTEWLYNVASTGIFVKNPSMTGWTTGSDGIPENWAIEDAS